MSIQKHEFEFIKAELANAINGNAMPPWKSPASMYLVTACAGLAASENTELLAALGAFAVARLVDRQGISAAAERELAITLQKIKKQ